MYHKPSNSNFQAESRSRLIRENPVSVYSGYCDYDGLPKSDPDVLEMQIKLLNVQIQRTFDDKQHIFKHQTAAPVGLLSPPSSFLSPPEIDCSPFNTQISSLLTDAETVDEDLMEVDKLFETNINIKPTPNSELCSLITNLRVQAIPLSGYCPGRISKGLRSRRYRCRQLRSLPRNIVLNLRTDGSSLRVTLQ